MRDDDTPPRPRSSSSRLAASMRRSRSMQRLASDGEHASRLVLLLSLVVGITLGTVLPRDIPGAFFFFRPDSMTRGDENVRSRDLALSERQKRTRAVWARRCDFGVVAATAAASLWSLDHLFTLLSVDLVYSSFSFFSLSQPLSQPLPPPNNSNSQQQARGAASRPFWAGPRRGAGSSVSSSFGREDERETENSCCVRLLPVPLNPLSSPSSFLSLLSLSFSPSPSNTPGWYPQLITNFHARSVAGFSLDNILLNLLGFACYSAYNGALFFSHSARSAYRGAHGGVDSDVRSNDVFFAFHALFCTLLTALQAARYDRGGQRVSRAATLGCGAAALALAIYGGLWLAGECRCVGLDLLRFLNCLSYVKVCTTFVKYWPQIRLNAERKSTAGYNISNSITDLSGGVLSLSQQALDAWLFADITLVTVC